MSADGVEVLCSSLPSRMPEQILQGSQLNQERRGRESWERSGSGEGDMGGTGDEGLRRGPSPAATNQSPVPDDQGQGEKKDLTAPTSNNRRWVNDNM